MILNNSYRLLCLLIFCSYVQAAQIEVHDDANQKIILKNPAQRIVVLAPHLVEVMFAIGAGERLVGVVEYSNYPLQAKSIPQVGGYILDIETIVSLQPDLIIGWKSGNSANAIERLKKLGFTVYLNESKRMLDVPIAMEKLGVLAGVSENAKRTADLFRSDYSNIKIKYQNQPLLKVFYQIWNKPLMTINDTHLISDVINLCGGQNIFGKLNTLTPTVSVEAVLAENPDVIVASGSDERQPGWLADWQRWPTLKAAKNKHLFSVHPDLIQRPGPRILEGAKMICDSFELARKIIK